MVIQTNLLNQVPHPSTIICPISTNLKKDAEILRVHLKKGTTNLHQACDVVIDQIRTINNKQLTKRIGILTDGLIEKVKETIKFWIWNKNIILSIDSFEPQLVDYLLIIFATCWKIDYAFTSY